MGGRGGGGLALANSISEPYLPLFPTHCSPNPKKKLVDVYRHVFTLRHEVFTHRPIPDSEGSISAEDRELFRLQCNGICVTFMLLMCILEPAMPGEAGQLLNCVVIDTIHIRGSPVSVMIILCGRAYFSVTSPLVVETLRCLAYTPRWQAISI